ncbi:MAG: FmdB family zinc ribbon protein [Candidatus Omnitrophota bacterium]
MPTYNYECIDCGHSFECFQSMTDAPLKECPKCEGQIKKLISTGSGIIFKGSGFYQTDYKSSGSEKNKDISPAPCGKSEKCKTCEH